MCNIDSDKPLGAQAVKINYQFMSCHLWCISTSFNRVFCSSLFPHLSGLLMSEAYIGHSRWISSGSASKPSSPSKPSTSASSPPVRSLPGPATADAPAAAAAELSDAAAFEAAEAREAPALAARATRPLNEASAPPSLLLSPPVVLLLGAAAVGALLLLVVLLAAGVARSAGMDLRLRGRSWLTLPTTAGPSTSAVKDIAAHDKR
jgi:hypothetical protein